MSDFTWVKGENGIPWECPVAVVDEMRKIGHEPCDPPEDVDPAMAEHRVQAAARTEAAAAKAEKSKPTKAAAGGKAEKE